MPKVAQGKRSAVHLVVGEDEGDARAVYDALILEGVDDVRAFLEGSGSPADALAALAQKSHGAALVVWASIEDKTEWLEACLAVMDTVDLMLWLGPGFVQRVSAENVATALTGSSLRSGYTGDA